MGQRSARPQRALLRRWRELLIFVYRSGERQRFIRIGKTPLWSLEVARTRAKELRSIVNQGRDPARENRGREIPPVENLIARRIVDGSEDRGWPCPDCRSSASALA